MGQRSRKRGRREKSGGVVTPPRAAAAPAAASRSAAPLVSEGAPAPVAQPPRPYARSEARNEAARAALTPYADGERPWAIKVSAMFAVVFGGYNLVSFLLGEKLRVDGQKPGTAGVLLFALVMFTCAIGMWRMRYWAVLGFQALLVLVLLFLSILLIKVSNLAGLAVCLIGLSVGGVLFYKLVKAMGRMQIPDRERRPT